jgi:hypothetical protein
VVNESQTIIVHVDYPPLIPLIPRPSLGRLYSEEKPSADLSTQFLNIGKR